MKKNSIDHERFITAIEDQARKLEDLSHKLMDSTPKSEHQTIYKLNQCIKPILAACEAQHQYRMYTEGIKSILFAIDSLRNFVKKHASLNVMEDVDKLTALTKEWMDEVFSKREVEQYFRVAEIEYLAYTFSDAISLIDEKVVPEISMQIHPTPMSRESDTTTFQSAGRELVQRCTNLKSVILTTMPMYGPALQQSYNFNLARLDHFLGLLHEHCDENLSPDARDSFIMMSKLIQNLV